MIVEEMNLSLGTSASFDRQQRQRQRCVYADRCYDASLSSNEAGRGRMLARQ